ncbi:MAG: flavodoxin-dependent (E)-4-hydroxy-3-methylbut-2-enyl-diphosphate synthase [Candidatus Delongbacteria bacterium]|nr:flavodoxin-dependent (E)-4-hydroxy-3-methylbut-2-enyl-diphosphate synthase [Candidatus Delongbacteria bacterium]
MKNRKNTRSVKIGDVAIGADHDIAIQSMTNTKTIDTDSTIKQILDLEEAGCNIARIALPDILSTKVIPEIKKHIHIPLVGDIHFDYKIALSAVEQGIDKIRINPGNIGGRDRTRAIIEACKDKNIPIRIGVNSGSVERDIVDKFNGVTAEGMIESMSKYIGYFQEENFHDLVLSLKSSDVMLMIEAYRLISKLYDYPLHLGVTEAGSYFTGSIKSAVGLGILLNEGIGDTVRVSLTGDVNQEIYTAREILKSLKLHSGGVNIISCPTCGRTEVDLADVVEELEERIQSLKIKKSINVAVMGCAVNGPGEAREADLGIAGGKNEFLLFIKGEIIKKIPQNEVIDVLINEIQKLAHNP